jgi:hypothetical protein
MFQMSSRCGGNEVTLAILVSNSDMPSICGPISRSLSSVHIKNTSIKTLLKPSYSPGTYLFRLEYEELQNLAMVVLIIHHELQS